jgi:hypothetical protein
MLCMLRSPLDPEDNGNTFSEMSVTLYQCIWNHIPEDGIAYYLLLCNINNAVI